MPIDGIRRAFKRAGRGSVANDVSDELSFHINRRIDELIARGMSPADARIEAKRHFQKGMALIGRAVGRTQGANGGPQT